jgi:hypothetical protein
MGKRREPDIFDDNPLTEDFLEWMVSPDGQTAGEVSGLVFATLENASVDAKRRKVIWADGERLSIEQSAERIHAEHPDRPRELIEISLCSWFEHRVPESGSERQINELAGYSGRGFATVSKRHGLPKNDREVRTLK